MLKATFLGAEGGPGKKQWENKMYMCRTMNGGATLKSSGIHAADLQH